MTSLQVFALAAVSCGGSIVASPTDAGPSTPTTDAGPALAEDAAPDQITLLKEGPWPFDAAAINVAPPEAAPPAEHACDQPEAGTCDDLAICVMPDGTIWAKVDDQLGHHGSYHYYVAPNGAQVSLCRIGID